METPPTEVTEAEIVEESGDHGIVAVPETEIVPGSALFGTSDPVEVIGRATEISKALADVISVQGLARNFGGDRDHVQIEGWQLLGGMLSLGAITVWTRKVTDEDGAWAEPKWHLEERTRSDGSTWQEKVYDEPGRGGWEARVEVRRPSGEVIGGGEMECRWSERNWAESDSYALKSMAQTRAASKAYRIALGFVMTLAGYAATPAEEMDGVDLRKRRTQTAPLTDHTCPACGSQILDNKAAFDNPPAGRGRPPRWKCSSRACQGGGLKNKSRPEEGRHPWASWDAAPPGQTVAERLEHLVAARFTMGDLDAARRLLTLAGDKAGVPFHEDLTAEEGNTIWPRVFDAAEETGHTDHLAETEGPPGGGYG